MPLTVTLHTLNGDITIFCLMTGGCKATIADVIVFDEFLCLQATLFGNLCIFSVGVVCDV